MFLACLQVGILDLDFLNTIASTYSSKDLGTPLVLEKLLKLNFLC